MLFKIYPQIIPSALTVLYLIVVLLLVFSIQISVSFAAVAPPDGNPFSDKYGGVYAKSVINGSMSHVNIDQINILTYPKVFFQNTYGTSGTLVIHASQGASNSQMVVKSVQTGKIVNSFPGRSSLDYRTQKGVFRMIAVEENGWYEITIKEDRKSVV